jgi:hypothetical protein
MEFLIFIIPFLLFLYMLYKISKDDHVFLRRGIRLEEIFDTAFITVILSWILAQFFPDRDSYSPTYFVIAGIMVLYFFGRNKKFLVGRLFDFFTLGVLTALPLWLVLVGVFAKNEEILGYGVLAGVYLILDIIFLRKFLPKIMNRSLADGVISKFFIIIFSVISLSYNVGLAVMEKESFINFENIALLVLLGVGFGLLFKRKSRVAR